MSKKAMLELIQLDDWKENINIVLTQNQITCKKVLSVCDKTLNSLVVAPEDGWLNYIFNHTLSKLFPENPSKQTNPNLEVGRLFYLEVLRTFLYYEKENIPFNRKVHMEFLTNEEIINATAGEEYKTLLDIFNEDYIYEFMRIGSEITRYKTLAHICGVHFISMHVGRQLQKAELPVDLALVSGSAVGHDIGKYGCKSNEVERIPYLHYYYTDKYFKNNNMPNIGHIATNHSTWDLELENLSLESLILIYADFRVKSMRDSAGKEDVSFLSLKDSFDVILNKLDNVDEIKRDRYMRVYAKLKDFEEYMEGLGVNTDLTSDEMGIVIKKDVSLLNHEEVVHELKNLAIQHNISLMHKLNSETSFGNILEAARSEKNWKSIRAYINIFEEYFTYMTQKQKILTLNFLYELLMHREGDIRRQSADLLGNIIVHYDEEYRKEIPDGVKREIFEIGSIDLWRKYLDTIIMPDHKVTSQHRRWIGYTLKFVVESVLLRCKRDDRKKYLDELLLHFDNANRDDLTAFILLDSMLQLPLDLCKEDEIMKLMSFTKLLSTRDSLEIQIAALRFIKYLSENLDCQEDCIPIVMRILENIEEDGVISIGFLKNKIICNLGLECNGIERTIKKLANHEVTSDIFLENLKAATPWAIKSVNIELLLEQIQLRQSSQILHVATHFSNLIKVSERVAVRDSAGKALISIVPIMSLDQRNEVVIELTKGLEIGEYEFSKYIPEYLGVLALYLHPNELDEFIKDLKKLLESTNDRVASVTLNTLGILIQNYSFYKDRFEERETEYKNREEIILGLLLKGLSNYHLAISQEAFLVIGQYIFGSSKLSILEKYDIFKIIGKKMITLMINEKETELSFFNSAASLNHIYRFISEYIFLYKKFNIPQINKIAFFPGTFDPFSLSHKGIVKEIKKIGFEVYLALDEFFWSKNTQPRKIRRNIISMSIANEPDVYLFPDDIPINIGNPVDLKLLKEIFQSKEIYIVVGSDVMMNASSYEAPPAENSIHNFNHLVFKRAILEEDSYEPSGKIEHTQKKDSNAYNDLAYRSIFGKIIELSLPMYLDDISSTRIRENIDYNRDISNLIDPLVQNYIYDNSLYLREPQYKHILKAEAIQFEVVNKISDSLIEELSNTILKSVGNKNQVKQYLHTKGLNAVIIRDGVNNNYPVGLTTFYQLSIANLYHEFKNLDITTFIRKNTSGKIIILSGLIISSTTSIRQVEQLILTETLAHCLKQDFTYAIYHDYIGNMDSKIISVLERQGFLNVKGSSEGDQIYAVDMKFPITIFQDIETTIKEPFNRRKKVINVIEEVHEKFQFSLTKLYPGNLVLSFNADIMHQRLINKITTENNVSMKPLKVRAVGKNMCVPFGKILQGMAVPNTVTKALHTEKMFDPEINRFKIEEFPFYSPLINQIRTVRSFDKPVILVDDLLHRGYRIKELDPIFKKENIKISKIIVGILSGSGKDLMTIQGRRVDSVYFIPNLRSWFVESSMYPFIGGDSVKRGDNDNANLISSINLILPYMAPNFLVGAPKQALYDFSMTCLENARSILNILEEEYQEIFERNLTLNRLSEAILSPRCPDKGICISYDLNLSPSVYIANDIEKLKRLKNVIL